MLNMGCFFPNSYHDIHDIHWKFQLVAAADKVFSRPPRLKLVLPISPYREIEVYGPVSRQMWWSVGSGPRRCRIGSCSSSLRRPRESAPICAFAP